MVMTLGRRNVATYEETRQRHTERWGEALPSRLERLQWDRELIARHRSAALRSLIAHAQSHSPWHAARLADVRPDELTADDVGSLPTMTKDDLMSNFDRIVCDDRVTLAAAERHLAGLSGDAYLGDEFHVVASGGTSGVRGVFAYGWDAWTDVHLGLSRSVIADRFNDPVVGASPPVMGIVTASNATHMTTAVASTFATPLVEVRSFPVTLPLDEIVDGLNRAQPSSLTVYASMLGVLAGETLAGRLQISPLRIVTTSEPLLPEVRALAETTFGAPVANCWGTSEGGVMAVGCWQSPGMHVNEDLVIIEAVDEENRPVPPGERSAKVLVTNLFNPLLPLIRYELSDEVTVVTDTCPCGSAYGRIDDILGRSDDLFVFGDVIVHPHVLRSPLARAATVTDYQVRQGCNGVEALVRAVGTVDTVGLASQLREALRGLGVVGASAAVRVVDELERDPNTGKLKRFVPTTASGE